MGGIIVSADSHNNSQKMHTGYAISQTKSKRAPAFAGTTVGEGGQRWRRRRRVGTTSSISLAVCRHSTIGGAARALGVNHSTVLRRLASLEETLGQRLFDRMPSGYVLTERGHELAANLAGVAEQIDAAERRIAGGDLAIEGTIRLTTTDTLLHGFLMTYIAEFHEQHPAVEIQIVINNSFLNLTRR